MRLFTFRNARVLILLVLLAMVAIHTSDQKLSSRAWHVPLNVTIFPINPEAAPKIDRYIAGLEDRDFFAVDQFMAREGARYAVVAAKPTVTRLGPEVHSLPPEPSAQSASLLGSIIWSLKLRWWVFRHTPDDQSNKRRVRMFVLFRDPQKVSGLRHSVGLQKGLFGIVHAYAHDLLAAENNIIIAHELLHTVGATDKYAAGAQPVFPDGYADPDRDPLHPQFRAEIMAVKIPITDAESRMPDGLRSVIVGPKTAQEINWGEPEK